jgi:RNA polymerase sigma-70 factor (ECF subfamily)
MDAPDGDGNALETLDRLLGRLPHAQREILRLAYWDGLTAAQISVVLGCSEQAVWKRISRAKAALRAAWPTDPPSGREETETYARRRDRR